MDFFANPDWFSRNGPYAFTLEHFLFIVIATLLAFASAFLLRKAKHSAVTKVLIGIWIAVVSIDVFKWAVLYILVATRPEEYPFSLDTMLPLHSCSMFMYVFPLAIFTKNKVISLSAKSFLVNVNMIMGYITMFVGFAGKKSSVFSFFGLHTLLYHALIFTAPLIMVVTEYYRPKKKDILYGLGMFGVLGALTLTFDIITGCDYWYFYDGHTFGVLKVIYENVPHFLIWTLIVVTCYILTALIMHFLILGAFALKDRHQRKKSQAKQEAD